MLFGHVSIVRTFQFFRIVKLLLEYSNQLDLNAQDQWKNTPLHMACEDDAHVEASAI